jgi:hypothetical protein
LTLEEAAKAAGAPPVQLIRWAALGVGPKFTGHPLNRSGMRYDLADIEAWKAARNQRYGNQNRRTAEGL